MKKVTKIEPASVSSLVQRKLRVAAYCRVSTTSEEQLESLNAQKEHYEKYIKAHPDWEFVGLYYDEGITGTKKEKRKGLKAMLTACELKQIDFIITKSISRFARNTLDCLEMVRKLIGLGIFLYFEKENLNTQSMESELILSILSSMAQDESTSISQNSKWSVQSRFKKGTFKISYPPYGYANIDGKMEVIPEKAEIVRGIFREALAGKGCYTIARELNESNTPTKKGGKWTGTSVRGILSNEKYTGDALFQKTYTDSQFNRHINSGQQEQYLVTNHHEAIINHKDFDRVQAVIRQRGSEKSVKKGSSKYLNRYVLSGKIICGNCGSHFKRRTHYTAKGSYIAWTCQTHIEHKDKCTMKYIRDDEIHKAFVLMMNKLIYGYKVVLKPLQAALKTMNGEERITALANLDERIVKNTDRKRVITELVGKGFLDATFFTKELSDIAAEAEMLAQEKKRLENSATGNQKQRLELDTLIHYIVKKPEIREFEDTLFERFVENIVVYSRNEIGFCMKCGITLRERMVN
ncbi:DNA invertase Pin-like site-specific DNA recombinase [Hypnocyclicus thermotrophus]|uniref:DNA invertase Pin-like site-specific DNA recombinase n=1 Tax=Hypnocyclicus thermotrophus TaxID=1627895 RepID=A0AA46DZ41_9FUSO|nr:recombinase family protein [Hypnocyclicus thermotrophus]TDT71513.1 DNA invertase Pin-like site-specific DNA recombinase [Hypnocyclicus thermotrophus]